MILSQLLNNDVRSITVLLTHITTKGVFDDKGKPVIDKKTGVQKVIGDPTICFFEKCIR